tara:strand:- start:13719 stop:14102 length:384 start_codon:yes stop_codon:yes gene_type:complete
MAHKGIRQYQGSEIGNLGVGQNGWYLVKTDNVTHTAGIGTESATSKFYEDVGYWAAIKCLGLANSTTGTALLRCVVEPVDGWKGGLARGEAGQVELYMQPGDVLYGAFKSIKMQSTSADVNLIMYRG